MTLPPIHAWLVSYAVYLSIIALAYVTHSLPFAWHEIKQSCPLPRQLPLSKLPAYIASSTFLVLYAITVFYVIFGRITDTKQRGYSWFSLIFMGVVLGWCDALVLVMSYRAIFSLFPASSPLLHFLLTLTLYLLPTAFFYAAVFNPIIAPPHRRPEWDLFKIITLTLSDIMVVGYLVYFEGFFMMWIIQSLVLSGIVSSMHFPAPWWPSQTFQLDHVTMTSSSMGEKRRLLLQTDGDTIC